MALGTVGFARAWRAPPRRGLRLVKLATTWLRKYIGHVMRENISDGQVNLAAVAAQCANFNTAEDPKLQQFWQCIDPATVDPKRGTGLARVYLFPFNHFRLAAHPMTSPTGSSAGTSRWRTTELTWLGDAPTSNA